MHTVPDSRCVVTGRTVAPLFAGVISLVLVACAAESGQASVDPTPSPIEASTAMESAPTTEDRRSAIPIQDHFSGDQLTLARAAGDGDVATVHRLAGAGGVDLDAVSPQGMPLLLWPIHLGNEAGLRALLDSGARPDVTDVHGNTPLIWAARTGQAAMVDALLAAGADPDARSARDEPALLVAATGNHWDIVELLLERGADIDGHQAAGWQTVLNHVASLGQFERAHWLLEKGADPTLRIENAPVPGRVGAQPILEAIFHFPVDAQAHPEAAQWQQRCQDLVRQRGIAAPPDGGQWSAARGR